jgi:hypothetical protein
VPAANADRQGLITKPHHKMVQLVAVRYIFIYIEIKSIISMNKAKLLIIVIRRQGGNNSSLLGFTINFNVTCFTVSFKTCCCCILNLRCQIDNTGWLLHLSSTSTFTFPSRLLHHYRFAPDGLTISIPTFVIYY